MTDMKRFLDYWAQQAKWWSSRSFEWWAAHLTAVYIGGAIIIMMTRFDELIKLGLNEVGDFSAGVFGPVAFLWLVLGYIQQGRELKISSTALQMQTAELKASVEQQTALAMAQRESLRQNELSFEPILELKHFGGQFIEGEYLDQFSLVNHGSYCDDIIITLYEGSLEKHSCNLDFVYKDVARNFFLEGMDGIYQRFEIGIKYRKLSGVEGHQSFNMLVFQGDQGQSIQIKKRLI